MKTMSPRKKDPNSRYSDVIRPMLQLTVEENWEVEQERVRQKMDKAEYLRKAVLYCVRHKIPLTGKE